MHISSIILILCIGCSAAPAPDLESIKIQDRGLSSAGAFFYTPKEYKRYSDSKVEIKQALRREQVRIQWLRHYQTIEDRIWLLRRYGKSILDKISRLRDERAQRIAEDISSFKNDISAMRSFLSTMNEGRLASKSLVQAELLVAEADLLKRQSEYDAAEERIKRIDAYLQRSRASINPVLGRYSDKKEIMTWRRLAKETIGESRQKGIVAIVVSKIERKLFLFDKGHPVATYEIGLGRNGLSRKRYSGDGATPEGRYTIVMKNPASRYYKALLIDYPNEDDRKRFIQAKRGGLIPRGAGIGALIAIHGGGKSCVTNGCISLDNRDMEEVFHIAQEGTPMTIVGSFERAYTKKASKGYTKKKASKVYIKKASTVYTKKASRK